MCRRRFQQRGFSPVLPLTLGPETYGSCSTCLNASSPSSRVLAVDIGGLFEGEITNRPAVCGDEARQRIEEDWKLQDFIRKVEVGHRQEIISALQTSRGCIAAAARRLRIPRSTLRHRMKKHGIAGA